ncbi:MAG: hypothetical protein IH600_02470 [Bacteroidetes bacterium]|nr:hypothetical protein [Bacteroidota bacterium]
MRRVSLSWSLPSKIVVGVALVLAASACSSLAPPTIYDWLHFAPTETQVWNNRMPGTKPRCNAQMHLQIINKGEQDVRLHDPEATLIIAPDGAPLRRFSPLMTINDKRVRDLTLAKGDSIEVVFRSPDFGLEPIDGSTYPQVRFMLRMQSSVGETLLFGSPVVKIFETQ